jgi:hypothetical protein
VRRKFHHFENHSILKKYLFNYQPGPIFMKESQPFFTLSHFYFSQNFLSMNVLSYSRRLAQGVLVLLFSLAVVAGVNAQCTLAFPGAQPVPLTLNIPATPAPGAVAVLDASNSPVSVSGSGCFLEFSTTIGGPYSNSLSFACGTIPFSPLTVYVRGNNGMMNVTVPVAIALTIRDVEKPTLALIGNQVLSASSTACGAIVPGIDATFSDNCGVSTLSWVKTGATSANSTAVPPIQQASNTFFNVGVTTVTYTATDNSGNSSTTSFTVTINDNTVPTITCPGNVTVTTDAGICTGDTTVLTPVVGDNCGTPALFHFTTGVTALGTAMMPISGNANGVDFNLGTSVINYIVRDAANNSATCSFSITVQDNQKPVITCPTGPITRNITTTPGCNYTVAGTEFNATATDNCGAPTLTWSASGSALTASGSGSMNGQVLTIGATTITWTAVDGSMRSSSCSFVVNVKDNSAPVISLTSGPIVIAPISATDCSKVITFTRPDISALVSDCGAVTMSEVVISGPDLSVLVPPAVPAFNTSTGGGSVTAQFPAGITRVAYYWIDAAMNFDSVHYTFVVQDTVKPVAACKNLTVSLDAAGDAYLTSALANNGSTDNCPLGVVISIRSTNPNVATNAVRDTLVFECPELGNNPYSLTITDASGNSRTATCTVTIVDNSLPTVVCPADITVSTGTTNCTATGITSTVTATDNCAVSSITWTANNGAVPASGTGTNISGIVFQRGVTDVVFTVRDASSNVQVCNNFQVFVVDEVDPVAANCPTSPILVAVNTVSCSHIPSAPLWNVTWSDNCSGSLVVNTTGGTPTNPFPQGETTITITATDQAGNIGNCTFVVDVAETTPPTANCKNVNVNLGTPTTVTAVMVNNNSTDNCTLIGPSNLALIGGNVNISATSCSDIPVSLVVTDRDGNKDTCTATIIVNDNIAPICNAQNATINLNASGVATLTVANINNGSSDNCGLAILPFAIAKSAAGLSANSQSLSYACNEVGTQTVFFKVTDAKGNTCTKTATVTVIDNIPPSVVAAPGNITVNCDIAGGNSSNLTAITAYVNSLPDATFADNCSVVTPVTETVTVTPGTCPSRYTINRKWVANDPGNLMVMAQQTITVQDTTKPTLTLPANVTINLSSGNTCTPSASYTATATDNCSGTVTTTWVIDYAGAKPDTTGVGLVATSASGFTIGLNKITFTAVDQCGNSTVKTMNVTVVDNVKPVFASYNQPFTTSTYCGKAFTYDNTAGICGYTFQWVRPWNGDMTDCSSFTFGPESITAVTQTGTQNLSVNPVFVWDVTNSFTELVPLSLTLPVGTTTFTYTATDAAMNTQTCSFTVKVNDVQAPTLTGSTTAVLNSICPTQLVPDYTGLVNVMDNCPQNVTLSQSIVSPVAGPWTTATTLANVFGATPILDNATFVVRITANDGVNPAFNRDITITLDDNTAPIPTLGSLLPDTSLCGYIILAAPTANPNCASGNIIYGTPGGIFSSIPAPGFPLVNGQVTHYRVDLPTGFSCTPFTITWTYNDGNNNTSSQPQQILLCPDVTAPVAKCKPGPISITLSPITKSATLTTAMVDNMSFDPDNCHPFTLSLSKTNFTCADVSPNNTGSTTVTLTASQTVNAAVLSSQCTVQVKVIDDMAPVFVAASLPANITVDTCSIGFVLPAAPVVTAVDSCGATVSLAQVSTQGTSGITKYNYVVTRTWTATDVFGNTTTAVRTITVRDVKKPVFATVPASALNFTTALVTTNCSGQVKFNLANFVSDCAPDNELSIVVSPAYFSLTDSTETLPVGSHTVNFTVTDPAGNSATTALTFVVKDVTKPTASCINGISVALNANGQAIVTPSLINNQSSDNCGSITLRIQELDAINGDTIGAPATQISFDCSEADSDTQYPIILWVTDQAGNFNFCETSVVIQDNVAPVITCPANVTVACSPNPATAFSTTLLGKALATDNCNNNVVNNVTYPIITNTDAPVSNGYTCSSFVRTFKASDLAGNMATCTQSITVIDTIKPVFTVKPPSDTIACNDPLVVAPTLIATDNCSPTDSVKVILVENSTKATTGCGKYNYTTTRTWTATDKCGNSTVHTQVVKVEDTAGPKFTGMPDTINILTANFPPTTNCTAPVALNAAQFFNECALLTECTINSIVFSPVLAVPITPTSLNVSGNYPVGTTKVIFTVTDPCGNVGKDSVIIIVKDNSAPIVTCNNSVEVALTNNGLATISVNDIDLNSNDNCGIATRVLSQTSFDCEDLGVNTVVLTVTDVNGNSNSCQASVEVTANAATGFSLDSIVVAPTFFGGANGSATVVATGGSNTFSYAWNTMATTASLTNIAAGTYTVAVSDQFSGCQQVINVVVPDGPKVKFTVGNATGAQNTVVKVPVTVDNFSQISGFTFTLNIPNAVVGAPAVPALANINPALGPGLNTSVSGNTISVLYLNTGSNNVSLPNGTVLFNICVQLSGAALGTSSPVNIENAPVAFQVLRGTTIIPTDPVVNGSVQITAGLNSYDIIGDINPWQNPNAGIPNVKVTVTGPTPALPVFTSTSTGIYQFNDITANTNTTTSLTKTQSGNNNINIIDQGLLLLHIFANPTSPSPLTSPYQRVAADVNFDGKIDIIDFALIQRLLLGTVQNLEGANAKDWVFIPKSYVFPANTVQPFPNPTYQNLPIFPQTIAHTPLFQDQLNDDFIGVRMGDLDGNAPLNMHGGGSTEERGGASLKLRVQDRSIANGETVNVAFKAKDFVQQNGYQFTFEFDPTALELQEVQAGAVPGLDADAHFGTTLLSDGLLSTAWVNLDPVTIADDETLFTLVFKATAPVNALSQVIHITNDIVVPMAVKADGSVENVEMDFSSAVSSTGSAVEQAFVLYQNQPNPFLSQTNIGFRLPMAERCTFRVYNSNGHLVKTVIGNFEKGYNAIQLRNSDLGGAGVYYYELSTPSFSDRKKLVFIN